MINQLRNLLKTERGFTLIELLIVIAIIAILTVAFLPGALKAPARARDAGRIKTASNIQAAVEGYIAGHQGAYPAVAAGADGTVTVALQTALGITLPTTVPATTYYYFKNGATPTYYAIGFVPENTGSANSAALTGFFVDFAGNWARASTDYRASPPTGTSMYVVTGPI